MPAWIATTELALILPVMFLVFAGILEVSRLLMLKHSADTAAYEAARSAIVVGAGEAEAQAAAAALLAAAQIDNWTLTLTPQVITESTPRITVLVEIPVASNLWISPFFSSSESVEASVSLATERPSNVLLTGLPSHQQDKGISIGGFSF